MILHDSSKNLRSLRSVLRRGHLAVALVAVTLASISLTVLGGARTQSLCRPQPALDCPFNQLHRRGGRGVR